MIARARAGTAAMWGLVAQAGKRHPYLAWTAFAVLVTLLLTLRALAVRDQIVRTLSRNLDIGLDVVQADVASWKAAHQSQASMVARLFAETGAELPDSIDAPHLRFLQAVAIAEHYAGIWVFDGDGRRRGEVVTPRGQSEPSLEFIASASAPGRGAERRRTTIVVLRTHLDDSTFRNLNPTSSVNRTARTSLLTRVGDSVVVVATRSHSETRAIRRVFPWHDVPPFVRTVLGGARTRDVGRGMFGQTVAYAAQPTLTPGWALIREMEMEEYEQRLWPPLLLESALYFAIAMLLAFVVVNRTRAASARREHELARLRTEFVASASHELRTPLAQVQLFSELLRSGGLTSPADTDRALSVIASEAQRLSVLVDALLNFAALRSSDGSGEPQTCDLAAETSAVLSDFATLASERQVTVVTQLEQGVLGRIGSEAFRQIVINYLDNAVKYGAAGQTITIRVHGTAATAVFSVEDEGPGVPHGERERIWQAFYRQESSAASGKPGSGIGLAVVRDLAMQAGGSARVESGATNGARFVVDLPRATEG